MIEIYKDIPESVRSAAKFWFEVALSQVNAKDTIKMLNEYRDSCEDEHEREFIDFYFNMRMQQIIGEEI